MKMTPTDEARSRAAKRMNSKREPLIIGVDGGGSKTAARIASVLPDGRIEVLGEGYGGPSNVRSVGAAHAKTNLEVAIDAAHEMAGTRNAVVDIAVLALAGSALPDVQAVIREWARQYELAEHVEIVHDAEPVLAVGAPEGSGIGLIVGTGSVAIGIDADGRKEVVGGWGHWFGDQGSGYDLGRCALAAVAEAVDGVGRETVLVEQITERLQVDHPRKIARELSLAVDVRQEIAALAPLVLHAARMGDVVAQAIVDTGVSAIADLIKATIAKLGIGSDAPLALAGSIACSGDIFREKLLGLLKSRGINPRTVTMVSDPVQGSLMLARDRLAGCDPG